MLKALFSFILNLSLFADKIVVVKNLVMVPENCVISKFYLSFATILGK